MAQTRQRSTQRWRQECKYWLNGKERAVGKLGFEQRNRVKVVQTRGYPYRIYVKEMFIKKRVLKRSVDMTAGQSSVHAHDNSISSTQLFNFRMCMIQRSDTKGILILH